MVQAGGQRKGTTHGSGPRHCMGVMTLDTFQVFRLKRTCNGYQACNLKTCASTVGPQPPPMDLAQWFLERNMYCELVTARPCKQVGSDVCGYLVHPATCLC